MNRFDYVKYDEKAATDSALFKQLFERLEKLYELLLDGRAKSLALTSLEEAYMWTGKAIRDEQVTYRSTQELSAQELVDKATAPTA